MHFISNCRQLLRFYKEENNFGNREITQNSNAELAEFYAQDAKRNMNLDFAFFA